MSIVLVLPSIHLKIIVLSASWNMQTFLKSKKCLAYFSLLSFNWKFSIGIHNLSQDDYKVMVWNQYLALVLFTLCMGYLQFYS